MSILFDSYLKLNQNTHLTAFELHQLTNDSTIQDYQFTSLVGQLMLQFELNPLEWQFINDVKSKFKSVYKYIDILTEIQNGTRSADFSSFETKLLSSLYYKEMIGAVELAMFFDSIKHKTIDFNFLSLFLLLVKVNGFSASDLLTFTKSMVDSGQIFDYRNHPLLKERKIIRRYPTGGLSEKIAIIMPSLLMAFADEYPIASPFLVAKSLSFTGGTGDKFKSLDGFVFPTQGASTIDTLRHIHVAMSITNDSCNPADSFLYQFRSVTNNVEARDLIISSIASKQLAIPPDALILDVRYGNGAFLKDEKDADDIGNAISDILHAENIKTKVLKTDTVQPNGMCIGNCWELLEGIAIMKGTSSILGYQFDTRALKEQLDLVVKMTVSLLQLTFPELHENCLIERAHLYFSRGVVFANYLKLLKEHGVDDEIIKMIEENKNWISGGIETMPILSEADGVLVGINQRLLGNFVNFELGNAGNMLIGGMRSKYSGVILKKRLGDYVKKGEPLAFVMSPYGIGTYQTHLIKIFSIKSFC